MSWAGDRLSYLYRKYSYNAIQTETGIPARSIPLIIAGERTLKAQYILNLNSFYRRTMYAEVRLLGATVAEATRMRGWSVARVMAWISGSNDIVEKLAQYRLEQYNQYLRAKGLYKSDADTLNRLRESIRKAMARSPFDPGNDNARDSPSLRHIVTEDEE